MMARETGTQAEAAVAAAALQVPDGHAVVAEARTGQKEPAGQAMREAVKTSPAPW